MEHNCSMKLKNSQPVPQMAHFEKDQFVVEVIFINRQNLLCITKVTSMVPFYYHYLFHEHVNSMNNSLY